MQGIHVVFLARYSSPTSTRKVPFLPLFTCQLQNKTILLFSHTSPWFKTKSFNSFHWASRIKSKLIPVRPNTHDYSTGCLPLLSSPQPTLACCTHLWWSALASRNNLTHCPYWFFIYPFNFKWKTHFSPQPVTQLTSFNLFTWLIVIWTSSPQRGPPCLPGSKTQCLPFILSC